MSKHESPLFDRPGRPIAKGLELLSGVVSASPYLTQKFMKSEAESHRPIRWRMADQGIGTIEPWATFEANVKAGPLAGSYNRVGLIGVRKRPFEQAEQAARALDSSTGVAVAYQFVGKTIMAGVLPDNESLVEHPEHSNMLVIGMGIGRGSLVATIGLWNPKHRHLQVPSDFGVEALGEPYPAKDFPSDILAV